MDVVYEYVSNAENLPQWESGLADASLKKSGKDWVTKSPMGEIRIRFVDKNQFGVVDHEVFLPSGEVNYNPMRVVKNEKGSELSFTLFRLPRMSEKEYKADAATIQKDLKKVKTILEK